MPALPAGVDGLAYTTTDVAAKLRERTGGRGPDVCIEAVGMEARSDGPFGGPCRRTGPTSGRATAGGARRPPSGAGFPRALGRNGDGREPQRASGPRSLGTRRGMMKRALWQGAVAGTAGVLVMTLGEKVEQRATGRPDSHIPARTMERLTGMREDPGRQPVPVNLAMHVGQGALLGILRSGMSHAGLRGPWSSGKFAVVRITSDQILENATGVGAPPQTWPRRELVIDLLHKTVYAFATGAVADALAARSGPGPGQRHAALRPGRHSEAGPLARGRSGV